ncbi:hypothetical protein CHU00_09215 [Sphingobacterium cellulitidis]|uniref:hypothetical protein n=1 Tax=Sphingobacterium cellulitidis TaxID=1768011 RepID=UPI000B93F183|nr:hypothetical protein [Sphingobacterium cellulitidis]OYD45899.1 hypothetical protein CHU00_09215 [Sphingobacterium cellulitidis]
MSSKDFVSFILNPFEDLTTRNQLIIGIVGFILLCVLSYFFHFINDGIIFLHFREQQAFWTYLVNGLINTGSLTILMYCYGKFNYSKTRFLDVLITVLIAQCVLVLMGLLLLNPYLMRVMEDLQVQIESGNINKLKLSPLSLGIITLAGIFSIFAIYYFFQLLVKGMKIAINSNKLYHTIAIVLLTLILNSVLSAFKPYF